uniref:snRNA-activating protein complex subunit 4 n=1 Tax=Doryrhamphus excisus TaxID=161450 RepID=UPI0025AE6515|nr:snRNA-activating protein complex subunit 4 [Doryrhamphus excisus]XP_057927489.1 snRNA-activating protein complex subunit 4 [Doryrhamphus excisus]
MNLSEQRDRIRQQVEDLERSLCATETELDLLSSDTDDQSNGDSDEEAGQETSGLLAQRDKIQSEIQNLENFLGPHSSVVVSDDDSSSSDSELGLSPSVDLCLQMNLVYQQVLQEKLQQLDMLMTHNLRQQKDILSQLSGPMRETSREDPASSSYPKPTTLFLGHFLKPYFKDKLTGLGPPANQETQEKMVKMKGCLDYNKIKVKRWGSWQKALLIDAVSRDSLRRLIQPKLSRVDYLSQKLSSADESSGHQLRSTIESLEKEIESLRAKKAKDLIGEQFEDHDWQKIANIDFEGLREAEDICLFWQNFLHPSVNKSRWSAEEVQKLKEISRRHEERHWDLIAAELGTGRTAFMCLQTFQRFISDSLKRRTWTESEDQKLRELVDKMRIGNFIPYTQISYFMEGRDTPQLIYRWCQVLDPSLKKGPWSKEEDQMLLRAVARHGEKSWWKIRLEVPGRTDSACRDRYKDCLKEGTKKGTFDDEELELLKKLVDKHGVGRWAKIAAEVPNRNDAQCMRAWKTIRRRLEASSTQRRRSSEAPKRKRRTPLLRVKVKKKKKEEEEEEESSDEEEEAVVKYMESDEEEEEEREREEPAAGDGDEEEQEEYRVLPMSRWIPDKENQVGNLPSWRPVTLPTSSDPSRPQQPVRSTVLGKSGWSVAVGPPPQDLRWEERHGGGVMMMLSHDQLYAQLSRQAADKRNKRHPRRVTETSLDYQLQAAVSPWIGNLLIPSPGGATLADALGECGGKSRVSSTPIFLLLLHAMSMDTTGCKKVIERRKDKLLLVDPPPLPPAPLKSPKTVAGMLQRRQAAKNRPPDVNRPPLLLLRPAPPTRLPFPSMLPGSHFSQPREPSLCLLPAPSLATPTSLTLQLISSPPPPPPLSQQVPPSLAPPPPDSVTANQEAGRAKNDYTYTVIASHPAPKDTPTGKKRGREEECVGGASTATTRKGKRIRNLSQKAIESEASANQKRRSSPKFLPEEGGAKQVPSPKVSSWAPRGAVQMVQAPPPGQLFIRPSVLLSPLPPRFVLQPVCGSAPSMSPRLPQSVSPPTQKEDLTFDPSLIFPESPAEVRDWLSGRGGVVVPELGVALPYLPPFVSSLSMLSVLLHGKASLARTTRRLLSCHSPRPQATPQGTPPRPADSTSDEAGASVVADEEAELLLASRQLVKERFAENPAYQMLKARFLSCFTLPALLASLPPVAPPSACQDEDEDEEDAVKVMTKRRERVAGSRLLPRDGAGDPASHFTGINAQPRPSDTQ